MPEITVIVLTKNVADRIRAVMESVRWADEILVVDSGSTDETATICREYTNQVLEHPYEGYAAQQNFALGNATHDWVLLVDSDELVPPELAKEVRDILEEGPLHTGYFIYRENYFFGRRMREAGWGTDEVMRLFRKSKGRFLPKSVHPTVEIDGSRGWLKNSIRHEPYPTLEEYLEKFGRYTLWGARDAKMRGKRARALRLLFQPVGRFLKMYLLRGGFLAGRHGIVLSMLGAMSAFMKYARLWEIEQKETCETQKTISAQPSDTPPPKPPSIGEG